MKGLGFLVLIYLTIGIEIRADDNSDMIEMAKDVARGLAQDCKTEEEGTDADIEDIIENRKEASYKSKCIRKCMMKTFNLMEDDGSILIKNFLELSQMMGEGNDEMIKSATEIFENCKDIQDEDQCEKAFKFGICMEENARAKGLY